MYGQVNMHEPDKKEDAIDASGYTGLFHRTKKNLKPITELEFFMEISRENSLKDVFFKIRTIDKDRNGFVTELELDDIVKEVF